jgi:hypothetical protein
MAKFRSWNKRLQKFVYFKDGKYYFKQKCEKIAEECFNWNNYEQSILINKTLFYVGDIIAIYNRWAYSVCFIAYENGCIGYKYTRNGEFCKFDEYIRLVRIGNIHENKDFIGQEVGKEIGNISIDFIEKCAYKEFLNEQTN